MASVWQALGRFLRAIFGQWQPPPWAVFLGNKTRQGGRWATQHKRASAVSLLLLIGLGAGGFFGYRAWKNRPQPELVQVSLNPPGLTVLQEHLQPQPLTVEFEKSVAPLAAVDKVLKAGVALSPRVPGTWKWISDRQLAFTPKTDWPVGQEIAVTFDKKGFVAPHIKLKEYQLTFKTAPFEVQLEQSEFYQDPANPSLKKAVATFAFSHAVNTDTFAQNLKLTFEPSNKEEAAFAPAFHITYDKLKGKAFVHSDPLPVPQKDATVVLTLKPGTRAAAGGPGKDTEVVGRVAVPGLYNFFRIANVYTQVVDNPRMEPEQILFFDTSTGVANKELTANIEVWTLPVYHPTEQTTPESRSSPYRWSSPEMISPAILKGGQKLKLQALPTVREYDVQHTYRHEAPIGRFLYVQVKKGVKAFGGYLLGDTQTFIVEVPPFPRQLKIMHSGALLASSGDRKVSVFTRDVPQIKLQVARILPSQIQHLVARSHGSFAQPSFSWDFDLENMAQFQDETRTLAQTPGKPVYETLDLTPYLPKEGPRRGLFHIKVQSWKDSYALGESDERFILLSDLGVFVKRTVSGTRSVFVQSIAAGTPVADAQVEVLGKNGMVVARARTGADGKAELANLESLRAEKSPVLVLVNAGNDTSFLPWDRRDREMDVSRFDVGGVAESEEAGKLAAYGFSDRTLYRPQETFHVGFIVRSQDWAANYNGLPLVATITDPRGMEVKSEPVTLDTSGFAAIDYTTRYTAPTGSYAVNLYLVKKGVPSDLLGSTTVQVREFLPDRMTIKVELTKQNTGGWTTAQDLDAKVTLTNLYGTPASNKRVVTRISLTPGIPSVRGMPGFRFYDPLKPNDPVQETLAAEHTNDDGTAEIKLNLQRFATATYRLSVMAEGFEGEGGRSVAAEATTFVSPLPYMIGYKTEGDLSYLHMGSAQVVLLAAASPEGERMSVGGLTQVLLERTYVSALVKQANGTYRYESVGKDVERSRKPLQFSKADTAVTLPTDKPGTFFLTVQNAEGLELQRVPFTVAGQANLARTMDRITELQLSLANASVDPGAPLEVQIKAPYAGSGLITIERDRVYAHKWFHTDTTGTIEKIDVPAGLEAGGYVSVAMIRDAASADVFVSPLSYGIVPFSISRDQRRINVKVDAPALAKPGVVMKLNVTADKPGRAVVFAVDEGILRVAKHPNPDPLGHFLQKRQLGVSTTQILDLILPEHRLLMQALAPGGGDEADASALGANLNPFKRKQDIPAVYWSGLVDVGPQAKELSFLVPDSFAGTLRVMAVAANASAVGAYVGQSLVRGDFVISPNVPTFVAPGDVFDVPVTVANNVEGSGKAANVTLTLQTTPHVEVVGSAKASLTVGELHEAATTFKLRAKDTLGSAGLTWKATLGKAFGQRRVDVSVRPAAPFLSTLNVGYLKNGSKKVPVQRQLYGAFRTLQTGLSPVPTTLSSGLARYLEKFPHGCTEQISSQAVPALVMASPGGGSAPPVDAANAVSRFTELVATRQNDEGGFGLWVATPNAAPLASVYTMLVLTEAKDRGFPVAARVMDNGLRYLETVADATPDDLAGARLRTMAIYVLTRNAVVTTRYASAAQKHMEANHAKAWRDDPAAAYLAGAYALLQDQALAEKLSQPLALGRDRQPDYAAYYDNMAHDAQVLYVLAKHFAPQAAKLPSSALEGMLRMIEKGAYNTFSSAFSILALDSYARAGAAASGGQRSVAQWLAGKAEPLALPQTAGAMIDFSPKASALEFNVTGDFGAYFVVSQQGFDQVLPTTPRAERVEVFREYIGKDNATLTQVAAGDELRVRLRARSLDGYIPNAAIIDLLPGGFEVVIQSASSGTADNDNTGDQGEAEGDAEGNDESNGGDEAPPETPASGFGVPIAMPGSDLPLAYGDVREDRVVLYADLGPDAHTFIYTIKATNTGDYVVPPILAESLYDRAVRAVGVPGRMTVQAPKQ